MNRQKCKEGNRICIVCKEEKPLTSEFFHREKSRPKGFCYRCKSCKKVQQDNRTYQTRKDKPAYKRAQRKYIYTEEFRAKSLYRGYKRIDKEKGYENDLTLNCIIEARALPCTYCGFKSSGLDRIDNSQGHTKANTVPCCRECNTARMNNFSHEEMKIIGKAMREVKLARIETK